MKIFQTKILCPLLGTAIATVGAFGGLSLGKIDANAETVEPSIETVNAYLANNGYSDEFIANTGEPTKIQLYNNKATFESESRVSEDNGVMATSSDWSGPAGTITVSNYSTSEENISSKHITFNWNWTYGEEANNEAVAIGWANDFTAIETTAIFSVYGIGKQTSYYVPNLHIPQPETITGGSFIYKKGTAAISDYVPGQAVCYNYTIGTNHSFTKYYQSGSYGVYQMNEDVTDKLQCTYSIVIKKYSEVNDYSSTVANYFHAVTSFSIDLKFTASVDSEGVVVLGIEIDPIYQEYYVKSETAMASFKYF